MTLEGKEKLEKELEELKTVKRGEIIERIKIARGFGDLSENSEYESAKDEQAFVEGRITTIENMIRFAQIIDNDGVDADEVSIGKTVTFIELPDGEEENRGIRRLGQCRVYLHWRHTQREAVCRDAGTDT